MRCSQCGLPLSPSRTHCPRCGTIAAGSEKRSTGNGFPEAAEATFAQPGIYNQGNASSAEVPQQPWGAPPASSPWNASGMQGAPIPQQTAFPMGNEGGMAPPYNTGAPPFQGQQSGIPNQMWPQPPPAQTPYPFGTPPQYAYANKTEQKKIRVGFLIAGLCVIAGGFLLVIVYVLSQGIAPTNQPITANQGNTISTSTQQATQAAPTAIITPTVSAVTPTPDFPARSYVLNAQMASAADNNTGRPTQLETTFKIKQQTIVTWQLNPQGKSGTVCLQWYINNQHLDDDFQVDVKPTSLYAFSFFYPGVAGSGYVELYWASSKACTDQVLAQRVNFTVSN